MKKILNIFYVAMLVCAFGVACEETQKSEFPEDAFTAYSLKEALFNWENHSNTDMPEDKTLIINSIEEMSECFSGNYKPIDFSRHTLIVASGRRTHGVQGKNVKNFEQLSTNKYKMDVEVIYYYIAHPERWMLGIVTDKIDKQSEIELNVIISDDEDSD